jgi:CRISPR-associated protein Cas1
MTTLYVREPGATIRRAGQRIQVIKAEKTIAEARIRDLERLVILGSVDLTSAALALLLESGIETVLLSVGGKYRGRLTPPDAKNVFLRLEQFRRYEDPEFRSRVARVILDAKLANSRFLLQRHHRDHPDPVFGDAIRRIQESRAVLPSRDNIASLLGAEGDAARCYFAALGRMVRKEFAFTTRTRRPPKDPVNALLSFGYTLLCTELTGALAAQGLDPHVGILHDLDYGRPSLALDLLEEFRQPVIDRLTLSLVNRGVLQPAHFEARGTEGILMNEEGRVRYLEYYHRALDSEFSERRSSVKTTIRTLLRRQAGRMRACIANGADYRPYNPN